MRPEQSNEAQEGLFVNLQTILGCTKAVPQSENASEIVSSFMWQEAPVKGCICALKEIQAAAAW